VENPASLSRADAGGSAVEGRVFELGEVLEGVREDALTLGRAAQSDGEADSLKHLRLTADPTFRRGPRCRILVANAVKI